MSIYWQDVKHDLSVKLLNIVKYSATNMPRKRIRPTYNTNERINYS